MRPDVNRTIGIGLLLTVASAVALAQSKYEGPFEKYRRSLDVQALGEGLREADRKPVNFDEDIKYLASVLTPGNFDAAAQEIARQELEMVAYSIISYSRSASIQNAFVPAMDALQKQIPEVLGDSESKWAGSLVSLIAVVGLQPAPPVVGLIYRTLDGKYARLKNIALLALARIKPLPPGASKILIERGAALDEKGRLEMWSFALDDSSVREAFVKYIEGENVENQRLATLVLAQLNVSPQPIFEQLTLLKIRKDLDAEVAANIEKIFAHH